MPSTMLTTMPTATAIANARVRPLERTIPSPANTAAAISSSAPRRTPQPSEPNSHSPMNSIRPISSRKTRKMTLAAARPPRASARRASPLISLASAFARSTWARTTRTAAARVALSWAIRPGGGSGAGRALSGVGRSGSSGRPPRGWAVVRETAADHSSARWRHRRVRSRHGRCNRVPIAGRRRAGRSSRPSCSRSAPSSRSARRPTPTAASWPARWWAWACGSSASRTSPTTSPRSWTRCAPHSAVPTSSSPRAASVRRRTT